MDRLNKILQLVVPVLLVSCGTTAPPDTRTYSAIDEVLQQGIVSNHAVEQTSQPSGKVADALLPAIELNLPDNTGIDVEPRFDIKVNRAQALPFFMGLVEGTPYNMVVHPKVKARITLDLKNVTVDDVMEDGKETGDETKATG